MRRLALLGLTAVFLIATTSACTRMPASPEPDFDVRSDLDAQNIPRGASVLYVSGVTREGFRHISSLRRIRSIEVLDLSLDDYSLAELSKMPALEYLECHDASALTVRGVEYFANGFVGLRSLSISKCSVISYATLIRIAQCGSLGELTLDGCDEVTRDGILAYARYSRCARCIVHDCKKVRPKISFEEVVVTRTDGTRVVVEIR